MQKSDISWTERTWNPTTGCNKVSQECKFCYAETIANRFWGERKFTDVISHEDRLHYPVSLKKPSMIFVNSMSDLFHEKVSNDFIREVYFRMALSQQHTFQVLTKRPERFIEFYTYLNGYVGKYDCGSYINNWYRSGMKNLWLGVSAGNVHTFDERRFFLSQTPAAVKFISLEPLLGNINFDFSEVSKPDWIIVGCESGAKRRECKIEWIENIVNQCKDFEIPVFVKQMEINGKVCKNIEDFPKHLQIQEYPIALV